jgi:nucleoside-diphosphate-sugar epimerase
MSLSTKALITGASGQIGRRLVRKLISHGIKVYAFSTKNHFENEPRVKFIKKSRGESMIKQLPKVDLIFHLASQTSAYAARESVARDIETNLVDSVNFIENLPRQSQPPRLIYAGSMTAYGMGRLDPINEEYATDPQTFYDVSKLATQLYLEQYVREGLIKSCVTLRLANVYGNHENRKSGERGFIDQSIWNAIEGKELFMYGGGNYIRDYLHIDDAVEAFSCAGKIPNEDKVNVFNVGTGQGTLLRSALELIVEGANALTGRQSRLLSVQFPALAYDIEKRNSIADASLFMNLTGWSPKIDFLSGINNGLAKTYALLDSNNY